MVKIDNWGYGSIAVTAITDFLNELENLVTHVVKE